MYLNRFNYLLFCYLSGVIVTGAFAPYNIWPFAFISPLLLLVLWKRFPDKQMTTSIIYGCGYFSAGSWIFFSFLDHSDIGIFWSVIATMIVIFALSLGFIIPHLFTNKVPGNNIIKNLCYFPVGWALSEYFRTLSSLACPWLFLAYSQTSSPFIYISKYTGVFGLSAIIILTSACIYLIITQRSKISLLILTLVVLLTFFANNNFIIKLKNKSLNTILVQNNVDEHDKWDHIKLPKMIANYEDIIIRNIHKHTVFILPETAIPSVPLSANKSINSIKNALHKNHATAILGTFTSDGYHTYNSIVSIGEYQGINNKRRLVAFGEATPDIPGIHELAKILSFPMSNITPSLDSNKNFHLEKSDIATFICYEIAFPEEVLSRGNDADIMVIISDNIWFGKSIASYQHRQIAQFYAIMLGKPAIFVNNSGASAVIGADGTILKELPNNVKGIIEHTLKY
jgi:apolipoprotein N-acyltransferase